MASADRSPRRPKGPPSAAVRNTVMGFLVLCVIAGYVGQALVGNLATTHPLLLIALNSRNTILVLASSHLSAGPFYAVGFTRLLVADPLFFLLGHWYGDAAVRWMERKTPTYGKLMRKAERGFSKAAYPLIAFAPNTYFCLFAGASEMNVAGFLVCDVLGTVVRLYLVRRLGQRFSRQLGDITHWLYRHWLIVGLVMVVLIGWSIWSDRKSSGSGRSELGQLVQLEHAIEADALAVVTEPDDAPPSDEPSG